MSAAVAAILEGMPEPRDLHMHQVGGRCVIMAGPVVLFEYDAADTGMRNVALAALRQLGFRGRAVAAVLGLSEAYVSTLHSAARREGSAALLAGQPRPGRPGTVTGGQWEQARAWRAQDVSDAEIGRRLGVANTTVGRALGPRGQVPGRDGGAPQAAEPLFTGPDAGPAPEAEAHAAPEPGPEAEPGAGPEAEGVAGPGSGAAGGAGAPPTGRGPGWPLIPGGVFASRYAGAMLLHAFGGRAAAGEILAAAAGGNLADAALLSAVSMCFALGAATIEQFKHLTAADAGPLAGLGALPGLRALRPQLAAIADGTDPLALQRMFAQAMLAADPVVSGVYYVDDHFVPYTGAKPVAKGWNNKRGRAERGRADTHVTAHDGRAVAFVTGEPSGLSVTLPKALKELKKAAGPGAKIMLGFDRGGAYPQVFRHCREQGMHWVTYRRAPLAVPAMLPVTTTITVAGRQREITWAEETVTIKDYGEARQITLFEHGKVALQILTSDFDSCPAEILAWLKSRWREENFLKYASENYGIDKICDYIAGIEANTKITDNPARKKANAAVRDAEKALAAAERELAALLADPSITPAAKNTKLIPAAQQKITAARKTLDAATTARGKIPAKLPANIIDPDAQVALLRTRRRGLQMVLRLLAHNAEHWLAGHLNAYLRDDDEYRAITRQTIIRGLAGTITYTPAAITVELQQPGAPRVTRALALLIDEINHTPPVMPGDTRPITYRLAANPVL
ncbi:MAG: putative transposase [Streptosporangiaceae bacterium]